MQDHPQNRIQDAVKNALKAKDSERVSTLRMLLADIKNEKIRRGQEVDDKGLIDLVRRGIKQRKDSIAQFQQGGRLELAAKEEREIAILADFLPQQADEAEVRQAIAEFVAAEGLSGAKAIGPVMKAMITRFGASVDSATINRLAREVLG